MEKECLYNMNKATFPNQDKNYSHRVEVNLTMSKFRTFIKTQMLTYKTQSKSQTDRS